MQWAATKLSLWNYRKRQALVRCIQSFFKRFYACAMAFLLPRLRHEETVYFCSIVCCRSLQIWVSRKETLWNFFAGKVTTLQIKCFETLPLHIFSVQIAPETKAEQDVISCWKKHALFFMFYKFLTPQLSEPTSVGEQLHSILVYVIFTQK